MGFPHGGSIQFLQVYRAALFWCNHHPWVPGSWGPNWYCFNYAWCNISVYVLSYFFQWWEIGIGVWTAVSIAPGTKVMSNGLLAIACNSWCGHVFNALDLKCSFIHFSCWFLLVEMEWYLVSMELMFYMDIHMGPFYLCLLMSYYVMLGLESQGETYPDPSRRFAIDINWMCRLPHTQIVVSPLNRFSCAGIKHPLRVANCLLCMYPMGSWHEVLVRISKKFLDLRSARASLSSCVREGKDVVALMAYCIHR